MTPFFHPAPARRTAPAFALCFIVAAVPACRCLHIRWGRVLTAGDVLYSADDYRARIAGLFRRLTAATANSRMWDASIFWLQELLNKEVRVAVCVCVWRAPLPRARTCWMPARKIGCKREVRRRGAFLQCC